ncbi:MAG: hypothetical protein ACYTBX_15500 [Planctomycetota bacterium]|jgi:hypothetical protein
MPVYGGLRPDELDARHSEPFAALKDRLREESIRKVIARRHAQPVPAKAGMAISIHNSQW